MNNQLSFLLQWPLLANEWGLQSISLLPCVYWRPASIWLEGIEIDRIASMTRVSNLTWSTYLLPPFLPAFWSSQHSDIQGEEEEVDYRKEAASRFRIRQVARMLVCSIYWPELFYKAGMLFPPAMPVSFQYLFVPCMCCVSLPFSA